METTNAQQQSFNKTPVNRDAVELVLTTTNDNAETDQTNLDNIVLMVVTLDCSIQEEEEPSQNILPQKESLADDDNGGADANETIEIFINDFHNIENNAKDSQVLSTYNVFQFDHNYANQILPEDKEKNSSKEFLSFKHDLKNIGGKYLHFLMILYLLFYYLQKTSTYYGNIKSVRHIEMLITMFAYKRSDWSSS